MITLSANGLELKFESILNELTNISQGAKYDEQIKQSRCYRKYNDRFDE